MTWESERRPRARREGAREGRRVREERETLLSVLNLAPHERRPLQAGSAACDRCTSK